MPSVNRYPVDLPGQLRDKSGRFLLGAVLLLAQQALMAKRDFLVRDAIDALSNEMSDLAEHAAIGMLVVSIGAAVVRVLSRLAIFTAGRQVEYELRAVLLDRLHRLGPAFFRTMPTGEVMSRATNDLAQVRLLLGFGILNMMSSAFALVSALYVMLSVSWQLTLASLLMLPLLMIVTKFFSTRIFSRTRENQEAIGKMSDRVLSSLTGMRVVRSFGLSQAESRAFEGYNEKYMDKSLALSRLRGAMGPMMGGIASIGIVVTFYYGGTLILEGKLTRGEFVSFWLALVRLVWPLMAIGFVAGIIQRGRAGYARLAEVFRAVPEVVDGKLPALEEVSGAVTVTDLSFAYKDREVLSGVSFHVPAGASLAIVGRTGSGKSTIASLLSRLMPTPPGTVFLDGTDVCDLPLRSVRANIGCAHQDAFLFSSTVAANIGYAADLHTVDGPVREAAREAYILPEIEALPDGFETVVGERGVQLSGGQRQRVSLARALLRESPVLVLDDPLSAVDAKTESAILQAIERQKASRTVILISHRIAAAKRCDSIVVLERGRIVEQGTHDELRKAGGLYAAFAEEQELEADLAAMDVDVGPELTPERA